MLCFSFSHMFVLSYNFLPHQRPTYLKNVSQEFIQKIFFYECDFDVLFVQKSQIHLLQQKNKCLNPPWNRWEYVENCGASCLVSVIESRTFITNEKKREFNKKTMYDNKRNSIDARSHATSKTIIILINYCWATSLKT